MAILSHAIISGLIGGLVSIVVMRHVYHRIEKENETISPHAEVFTYSPKTRRFLMALGFVCALFAIVPLCLIYLKYYGVDPVLPGVNHYRPQEDWRAGFSLLAGFGLGALMCLIEPNTYRVRLDKKGVMVRGMLSGWRNCA